MAMLHETHFPVTQAELPWALRQGAYTGIVAGLVFAAYEVLAAAATLGIDAFFMPLRMIGAIALGADALDPNYPVVTAALAGVVVHSALAIVYGMVFAVIAGGLWSASWDVVLGAAFGFTLWLVNFYVIAPAAFPWFLESSPTVQFIGHTFFFGAVLGWLVWRARMHKDRLAL